MTTHRSLNKLEFKAHMSIHNFTEVGEKDAPGSRYTRDRFGRKHNVADREDFCYEANLRKLAAIFLFFQLVAAYSGISSCYAEGSEHKSTNIQVSTTDKDLFSLDKKLNPPDDASAVFYKDASSKVGFNEDGDPAVSTQF